VILLLRPHPHRSLETKDLDPLPTPRAARLHGEIAVPLLEVFLLWTNWGRAFLMVEKNSPKVKYFRLLAKNLQTESVLVRQLVEADGERWTGANVE